MSEQRYRDMVEECVTAYVSYFDRIAWPKLGTDEWDELVSTYAEAFGEQRYSRVKIERAMRAIRRKPPEWKHEHLPELLRLIAEADENPAQPDGKAEQAEDPHAPACEHCGGEGFATIYRSDYQGVPQVTVEQDDGSHRRVNLRITAPCVCPKGRRSLALRQSKGIRDVNLAAMPRGWSFEDPTEESQPAYVPHRGHDPAY